MDQTLGQDQPLDAQAEREQMRTSVEQTGSLSAFVVNMVLVAQAACSRRPPDRARELWATLVAVTASDIAADVPPEAIGVLAAAGHHERASDLAARVAPESRSDAYYRIAIALKNNGHMEAADTAAAEAIAAARSYARGSGAHYMFEHLAYAFGKDGMPKWAQRAREESRGSGIRGAQDGYEEVEILADGGDIDGAWEAARRINEPGARDRALGSIIVGALARAGRFQDALGAASTVEDQPGELFADIAVIAAEHGATATTTDTVRSIPAEHRQWATHKAAAAWAREGRVNDAITLTQLIEDSRLREYAIKEVASTLAQTGQVDSAISVWTAAPPSDLKNYFTADLAKVAARAGDIDGALQVAAAINDDYPRRTAVAHAASAAALGGDMRRATALVRVIGHTSGEDDALAAVAKDLAAAEQFDDADAATGLIAGTTVQAATLVTVAGALAAAGDYQRSATVAGKATQIAEGNSSALIAWARALAVSGDPNRAVAAAERAVQSIESGRNAEKLAEALAAWSAALAASGRQAEALAAAERSMTAVDSPVEHWRSDQQYWRDRLAKNVAVIFAEAGLAEHAMMMARSLAQEHDRNRVLFGVAETLAQRGLADQAIEALRGSTNFTSFRARDDLGKIARILARHGHGDGALRAAYALAGVDQLSGFAEHYIASLVTDVARTLAENSHVEVALQTVRKSKPSWRRPAAYAEIACAVVRTGDTRQAVEIAETHADLASVAKVASALAESGRTDEALPIAEYAIQAILTRPPRWPSPADATVLLENMVLLSVSDEPDEGQQAGTAARPATDAAITAAQRAASDASVIADPAERIAAQAQAAVGLARTHDPALTAQATALAKAVAEHARQADYPDEMATLLAYVAMAFSLAGEASMAADAAVECLAAAAASPFRDDSASVALAVYALTGVGRVAEALAGLSSLQGDAGKAAILCGAAETLASHGRTEEMMLLLSDQNGLRSISETHEQICALTGLGRVYAETGEPGLTEAASDLSNEASALAGELTQAYEIAVALSGQAGLLAALGRPQEAAEFARKALEAAKEPIGGWRGQVVGEAVDVLVRCNRIEEAAEAAKSAPPNARAKCTVAVANALWDSGEKDRATTAISQEITAIRASGLRQAFYHLVCTELPKHPELLHAWIGSGTELTQISRELTAIERSWL
jgi:tetratricopeptide (TPR) repeat protein